MPTALDAVATEGVASLGVRMPDTVAPTLRKWELGGWLRRLRLKAGLSIEDAAGRLLCSPSKISRLETGARSASQRDVRDLCDLYEVGKTERAELMELARPVREPAYWKGVEARPNYATYMELEAAATAAHCWDSVRIPALLQIPEYSRAVISAIEPQYSAKAVDRLVETRRYRKRLLEDSPPLQLRWVIDEAAFHRRVGGPEAMSAQIAHVIEVSKRPNVIVQLLPFSDGAHPGMDGAFTVLDFAREAVESVVYLEGRAGGRILTEPAKTAKYIETFDLLRSDAASQAATQRRLQEIAGMMRVPAPAS
jgi:transcriptional regulator with XRE-family HTH domain